MLFESLQVGDEVWMDGENLAEVTKKTDEYLNIWDGKTVWSFREEEKHIIEQRCKKKKINSRGVIAQT
jgi:preprotein translocase subunit YajC